MPGRGSTTWLTKPALRDLLTYADPESGVRRLVAHKLPRSVADWQAKRAAVEATLDDLGGVVIRVGDETVGELWSLYDGQDVLNEVDPRFADNIRRHVGLVEAGDVFHVSANTDPKGDRSKRPQEQDPDMLLHVVRETDAGIVVRGAKYETAAAYAHQAFVKPTIANWGDAELSDYAVGFIVPMNRRRPQAHLPRGLRRPAAARGLSDREPLRRGRHAPRVRRRADPLGGCAVLPAHTGGGLHPLLRCTATAPSRSSSGYRGWPS